MKLNKKVRGVILGILLTVMIGVSTTYAFWRFEIKILTSNPLNDPNKLIEKL